MPDEIIIKDPSTGMKATVTDGKLNVNATATINASDIQIGAVEIKDATTDNRAIVDSSGNLLVTEANSTTMNSYMSNMSADIDLLTKVEDTSHNTEDRGIMPLGVRNDALATTFTSANGDFSPLAVYSNGALFVAGANLARETVSMTCGTFPLGAVTADTRPSSHGLANDGDWSITSVTEFGELRIRDDDANTLLGTIDADTGAIKTAVEIIDNAISGNEMQVDVVTLPNVKPNALEIVNAASYDVDASAILVVDASAHATMTAVTITNAGDETIYLYSTNSVASTLFFKKLFAGDSWDFPLGYTSDTTNDIYAIRASAETNDNVIVIKWGEV